MIASAARPAPSSHLIAIPNPRSGSAAQNTPSAPVFTSTRGPRSRMISVQNRPCRQRTKASARKRPEAAPRLWRGRRKTMTGAELGEGACKISDRYRPSRNRATVYRAVIVRKRNTCQILKHGAHTDVARHDPAANSRDDPHPTRKQRKESRRACRNNCCAGRRARRRLAQEQKPPSANLANGPHTRAQKPRGQRGSTSALRLRHAPVRRSGRHKPVPALHHQRRIDRQRRTPPAATPEMA